MFLSQISKFNRCLTAVLFSAVCTLCFAAEETGTIRLPGQHLQQHGDLLANQGNTNLQLDNATKYLESLFSDEDEPEFDIYTEGWGSEHVNCYANVTVPQTAPIDVSHYAMPHPGYITSPYGYRRRFRRMHKGVDLKINMGDTIRAAFDGKVRLTKFERRGYGYYVVLRHTNSLETVYGHLSKFLVEPDQYVKAGDPIALGGNTGRSTGPHLHFETRYMGYAINPCAIFDFANQTTHTDIYTFDKSTYQNARNFSPQANAEYAAKYRAENPPKAYVPDKSHKSGSASASVYKVKKGDTLGKIASRNGTTVARLCKLNGLKTTSTLQIGQKLKLR
ncbi:MAG: peptidoglycan DD-metalloendopeptidase family protein [Muribaculaceae bacterium]|nr:peptidoglycan DD-metalloendopeptidase family protein [Muribaculaceae bacterium]